MSLSNLELILDDESIVVHSTQKVLIITRKSGDMKIFDSVTSSKDGKKVIPCQGILGNIRLNSGNYLIVVKDKEPVGKVLDHQIYSLTKFELIPYEPKKKSMLTSEEESDELEYISLLESILSENNFYFSYTFDLTKNIQSNFDSESSSLPEDHFWWNKFLSNDLIHFKANQFILPIIRGFVQVENVQINSNNFIFGLISRQSCKRTGTRYNVRGIDSTGNNEISSFLQIRGSIPLFWSQKANLKYKPGVVIEKESDNAFKLHMDDLLKRYKNIVCVNLVDQKGSEKKLADEYKNLCKTLYPDSNVKYFDFDFHHECRKMNYGAIQKLVDQVDDLLQSFKEFSKNDSKIQIQTGVMRTNCMDNLDRTNVVQSTFAKHHLNSKLKSLGILLKDESINDHHSFILKFKDVWANNADQISFMYSGTGALKNDFTRTGKRTFIGLLNDGSNSAIRYFLNNFRDGKRQDSMNLFLGKYIVNPKEKSPFQKENSLSYFYKFIGLAFITGIIMAISNILMLFYDPHDMKNRIAFLIGWLLFTFIVYLVLMFFGKDVVNNPVLVNTKKLV